MLFAKDVIKTLYRNLLFPIIPGYSRYFRLKTSLVFRKISPTFYGHRLIVCSYII